MPEKNLTNYLRRQLLREAQQRRHCLRDAETFRTNKYEIELVQ